LNLFYLIDLRIHPLKAIRGYPLMALRGKRFLITQVFQGGVCYTGIQEKMVII
jgi:hypothetical protein